MGVVTLAAKVRGAGGRWVQRGIVLSMLGSGFFGCGLDSIDLLAQTPELESGAGGAGPVDAGTDARGLPPDGAAGASDAGRADATGRDARARGECSERCSDWTPICDPERDACVACLSSADCAWKGRIFGLSVCRMDTRECVECNQAADCLPRGDVCIEHQCGVLCTANSDCQWTLFTPVCDPEAGICVECLTNTDCEESPLTLSVRCNTGLKSCLCESDEHCREGTICSSAGLCRLPF